MRHFLRRFNEKNALSVSIDPAAVQLLQQMQWPGHDRELENIFAVQHDIAQSVVKELRTALLGEEINRSYFTLN